MTIWQFSAAVAGWMRANGQTPGSGGMSDERARELGIEGF